MKKNVILFLILLLGFILRIYGINWDQGYHLHPDERMLIMVADKIHFFNHLNPHFFNYGSFPLYVLKGLSQLIDSLFSTHFSTYDGMLLLGRFLSVLFDTATIYLVYRTAILLFDQSKVAYFSSFLYAIAFFPIQNAHFFVVDVPFTFLTICISWFILIYDTSKKAIHVLMIGMGYGLLLSVKISGLIFFPPIMILLLLINHLRVSIKTISHIIIFLLSALIIFIITMPYALLDWQKFIVDIALQMKMSVDPYIFPYTLQYVGTLPYIYFLQNIFLWGIGPWIGLLSCVGFFYTIKKELNRRFILIGALYIFYFVVMGKSAVKFMRYMLPLYPYFCLIAGYGVYIFIKNSRKSAQYVGFFLLIGSVIWTMFLITIYHKTHTRISASEWIIHTIPAGSTIAIEHWDDKLPLKGGDLFKFVELTLYDLPDDEQKWSLLNTKLAQSDYLILASNRLHVPLQKLNDCAKYLKCYPITARYYRDLFAGKRGFVKIAEFEIVSSISIGSFKITLNDQKADESFTVYDHPKVIILKKNDPVSSLLQI